MGRSHNRDTVLVVDDSQDRRLRVAGFLTNLGLNVLEADSGLAARETIVNTKPAVVVTALEMEAGDGLFLLRTVQSLRERPRMIVMSTGGRLDLAVEAMQLGAVTVLQRPIEPEHLTTHIQHALAMPGNAVDNRWVADPPAPEANIDRDARLLRGNSKGLERVYQMVSRVAPTDTNVLITGESGVGKELVAREIHHASSRANGPMVTVNCAAIPDTLLESELFGHKKGAFTNATCDRDGRFKQAAGGTIFLDEIGEMKLDLQSKLLRVLQEHEFQPVGGNDTEKGDFRVVAATNQKLEDLVDQGLFRKDLYYRLSVFPIEVLPLRDRKEDIEELTTHFIDGFNSDRRTCIEGVAPQVKERLAHYDWPGNIRELRNIVERMTILRGDGTIQLEDLPERIQQANPKPVAAAPAPAAPTAEMLAIPTEGIDLKAALLSYEVRLIEHALDRTSGNRNRAARLLKINRTTLVEKIKRLGIAA